MFDEIKAHVARHKTAYSVGAVVVIAGITYAIMRSTIAQGGMGVANAQGGFANTASFSFKNKQTINVINVLEREGRGHPGYPVMCIEDKLVYLSQKAASEAYNFAEGLLSGHLNGKFPDVDGRHFMRVSLPYGIG